MQNKKMLPLTDRRALVVYLQDMRYRRIAFQNLRWRWVYSMDGIDDRWTLASRAINPDGDIDIEFRTGPSVGAAATRVILSQNVLDGAGAEFILQALSTGIIQVVAGGSLSSTASAPTLQPNTSYRITLAGTTLSFWLNGALFSSFPFTRGAAREPTAQTVIGARTNGAVGSFVSYYKGVICNIRVGGTLWPMADRNQTIQLPEPSGLGAELITPTVLENPFGKGTQWTYLGDGRWQYVGDGSLNVLEFIVQGSQPSAGYVEFEIESITNNGRLSCTNGNIGGSVFSVAGKSRFFYLNINSPAAFASKISFKRAIGGEAFSCIIKNISFKPLGTCNPMTGVNLNPDRWVEIPK